MAALDRVRPPHGVPACELRRLYPDLIAREDARVRQFGCGRRGPDAATYEWERVTWGVTDVDLQLMLDEGQAEVGLARGGATTVSYSCTDPAAFLTPL